MHFYKTIIFGFCIFLSSVLSAQRCIHPTGLELSSNNDIINFSTNHPNCKTIVGDLRIIGPISSLNGLSSIDTILGNLTINTSYGWNYDFLNFDGINNLKYISKDLRILRNDVLVDDRGFDSLNYIGGVLDIFQNPSLKKVNSFKFKKMPSSIDIRQNDSLEIANIISLSEKDTLKDFILEDNKSLKTIDGLDNVKVISGQLNITKMSGFKTMPSFKNLDSIDLLYLQYMDSLENLSGLDNVNYIRNITVLDNPQIMDISAIRNAYTPLNLGFIAIQRNPSLEICNYYHICNYLNVGSHRGLISGNKGSCYNRDSIVKACMLNSINQLNSGSFRIYPNPVNNHLKIENINLIDVERIEMYNGIGVKQSIDIKLATNEMDVSILQNGIYILKIAAKGQIQTVKIIKQ